MGFGSNITVSAIAHFKLQCNPDIYVDVRVYHLHAHRNVRSDRDAHAFV